MGREKERGKQLAMSGASVARMNSDQTDFYTQGNQRTNKQHDRHTTESARTLGVELHLGRGEGVVLRNHDVHLEHAARVGGVIRTLQRLKTVEETG